MITEENNELYILLYIKSVFISMVFSNNNNLKFDLVFIYVEKKIGNSTQYIILNNQFA